VGPWLTPSLESNKLSVRTGPTADRAAPFDLFRQEALTTLKAVPAETIVEIVDNLFRLLERLRMCPPELKLSTSNFAFG